MNDIDKLVKNKISEYNSNQTKLFESFKKDYPLEVAADLKYDFQRALEKNTIDFLNDEEKVNKAYQMLKSFNYTRNKIEIVANNFLLKKSDLEKIINNKLFEDLYKNIDHAYLTKTFTDLILENSSIEDEKKKRLISSMLKKCVEIYIPYMLRGGFQQNYANLKHGVDSSNQGQGGEHIFVSKAMIAGFNASVVDVGSSGYDAIIENKKNDLLKVQVKSFTDNNISRKGRDRGGEGIDSSNRSNKGILVTSQTCDVFVAVNKKNAELFIFSKSEIDNLPEVPFKRLDYMENWENWSKIND